MKPDFENLDSLSDVELLEAAQRARDEALAKDAHAYALLGYLNHRRRSANPAPAPEADPGPQAA